jgi:hypothetical protein
VKATVDIIIEKTALEIKIGHGLNCTMWKGWCLFIIVNFCWVKGN